ncbi:hypothetical protein BJY24_002408 [Nocardia transvalensis]|uniref:Uncharacterized protein n=1 Tax=Nocardia transvalensis TaxID=37333 RepID=A0A7W9PCB8_9NOCA|nr:hypothetical protein [Nocardia transvalensis]
MNWRTRIFEFPGGVLELRGCGDAEDVNPGVYLELYTPDVQPEEECEGDAEAEAS